MSLVACVWLPFPDEPTLHFEHVAADVCSVAQVVTRKGLIALLRHVISFNLLCYLLYIQIF
jgi:hypothetical protein